MTQDERWNQTWKQYIDFLETNKRRPSKYKPEERDLVNWAKHNRKLINQGKFKESRMEKFEELKRLSEKYQRINQYKYKNDETDVESC